MQDVRLPWAEQLHPLTGRTRIRPRPQVLVTVLLVAAAFPARVDFFGRTVSLFDIAVVVALIPFLMVAAQRSVKPPMPFVLLAVASIALSAVSIAWSADPSVTMLYVVSSVEAILAFLMAITFLQGAPARQVARLLSAWVFLLLIPAALLWAHVPGFLPPSTLDPTSGDYISYFSRLSHPFIGRSNNLAALLAPLIIPLAVWALHTRQKIAGVAAFVALAAVTLTFSRGTLIALTVGVVLYFIIDGKNARKLIGRGGTALLVIGGIAAFTIAGNDTVSEFFSGRLTNTNVDSRATLLYDAQAIFQGNWFAGIGGGVGQDTHNTFMQQMVYFGLIGGLIIGVLLIWVAVYWFRKDHRSWLASAIGIGFLVQIGSFLVESSYEGTLLRPLIWLGWGMLVALWRAFENEKTLELPHPPVKP